MNYVRHNPNGSRWSVEDSEKLRKLWESGLSCSQIAREIGNGFTRNAIIGRAQRMGLGTKAGAIRQEPAKPQKAKQITPPKPRAAPQPKPAPHVGVAGNGMAFDRGQDRPPRVDPIPLRRAFLPLEGSTPRPWETRLPIECCWPIGEGLSCCEPKADDRYCVAHIATSKPRAVQKPATPNEMMRALRRFV